MLLVCKNKGSHHNIKEVADYVTLYKTPATKDNQHFGQLANNSYYFGKTHILEIHNYILPHFIPVR